MDELNNNTTPTPAIDKNVPGFGQAVVLTLIFWGINVAFQIIGVVVWILITVIEGGKVGDIATNSATTVWLGAAGNTISAALTILAGRAWSKRSWREILPLGGMSLKLLFPIVLLVIGDSILSSEFDNLFRMVLPMPEWLKEIMKVIAQSGLASFVVLVIVAPLTEEALFRGLILNGFLKRYQPRTAILLNATLFALFHINPYQFFSAFLGGLLMAWLKVKSNSLWPSIILHALFNGLVFGIGHIPFEISGYNSEDLTLFQPWWFDLLGVAIVIVGVYTAARVFKANQKANTPL